MLYNNYSIYNFSWKKIWLGDDLEKFTARKIKKILRKFSNEESYFFSLCKVESASENISNFLDYSSADFELKINWKKISFFF